MATVTRLAVNPDVLRWARTTADVDVATAATRVGVKPNRITQWESGEVQPTINQLRSMSVAYQRPLAALLMTQPLVDEERPHVPDFRRPETREAASPAALQRAIMRAHRQRDALREIAQELGWPEEATFADLEFPDGVGAERAGETLRASLRMDTIARGTVSRPTEHLRELVRRAEDLRITVIQVQRVEVSTMRGFSLGDGSFPIVALNGADWPRGKIFSLLHELAHVGFRSSGLCDLEQLDDSALERRCEQVAATALMPARAFRSALGTLRGNELTVEAARAVGNEFGASGEAAVLRMIELERADWDDYWRLKPSFEEAYRQFKREEKSRGEGKDAPIFYQLKARDLGRRFVRQVLEAYGDDAISSRDLVQLLEVSYDKIPKLAGTLGDVAV